MTSFIYKEDVMKAIAFQKKQSTHQGHLFDVEIDKPAVSNLDWLV